MYCGTSRQGNNLIKKSISRSLWGSIDLAIKKLPQFDVLLESLPEHDPREYETKLIQLFKASYSVRPFANLTD